jgi:hypothetical protein
MVRPVKRKKNPVPPTRQRQIDAAAKLFEDFSGHKGNLFSVPQPALPKVALVVGYCDGIMYETVRDGKTEKYLHQFEKSSRPLLAASSDGKQLLVLGGAYDFTDRGIVDRSPKP